MVNMSSRRSSPCVDSCRINVPAEVGCKSFFCFSSNVICKMSISLQFASCHSSGCNATSSPGCKTCESCNRPSEIPLANPHKPVRSVGRSVQACMSNWLHFGSVHLLLSTYSTTCSSDNCSRKKKHLRKKLAGEHYPTDCKLSSGLKGHGCDRAYLKGQSQFA